MRRDDALTPITPSEEETGAISELRAAITLWCQAAGKRNAWIHWRLLPPEDEPRPLSPSVMQGLVALITTFSEGDGAAVVPLTSDLTTQEAADLLGVSRPHLIRLVEQGELPYRKVGSHRRLRAEDVITYRRDQESRRRLALANLTEASARLGLYSEDAEQDPSPVEDLETNNAEHRTG
jgi:excisionase family DNA binding protein